MSASRRGPRAADAPVVAVVLGVLYASLARRGEIDCAQALDTMFRESRGVSGSDLLGNVFAYVLLGAALAFAWAARTGAARARGARAFVAGIAATAACTALSVSMEAAQACLTERVSTGWDVLWNASGGAIGWLLARAVLPAWTVMVRRQGASGRDGPMLAVVLVAIAAWAIAESAPWVPVLDAELVRRHAKAVIVALAGVARGEAFVDPWRLARAAGEWLAIGLAMSLPLRRPALAVLPFAAIATAVLGWRLLLPGTAVPSVEALATLPPALLAVALVPLAGRRASAALALAAVAVALLAYQLEPQYGPTHAFRWRVVVLHGDPIGGIQTACWFGALAAASVAAGVGLGGPAFAWATFVPLALAATEALQTALPGRTPDLSPPAMALAASVLAAGVLSGRRGARGARGTRGSRAGPAVRPRSA